MKGLPLSAPYDGYIGYLQIGTDGRVRMCMRPAVGSTWKRQLLSRYRMAVSLGRVLSHSEQVDHIDGNPYNDSLDNLQILTQAENNRKSVVQRGVQAVKISLCCSVCGEDFTQFKRVIDFRTAHGQTNFYCGRKCSLLATGKKVKSDAVIAQIKTLRSEGKTSYFIADLMGISRITVMKYWK